MNYSKLVAQTLLDIKAVGFNTEQLIRFKSGILSPVYVDNRTLPFHVKNWQLIINGFEQLISDKNIQFDVIAGIESAGIPHSAALGFALEKPSVFARKQVKDHGTKKAIEGGDVANKRVLLIEDLVTTGGSSLTGVEHLRQEKAIVTDCLVIVSYGFKESELAFEEAHVKLHALTTFEDILAVSLERRLINEQQLQTIKQWLTDPHAWTKEHEEIKK